MQKSIFEHHVEPWSGWATAAEDHSGHRLTKTGQFKTGKMLPGLINLDFQCDMQMIGTEFGKNNMDPSCFVSMVQAGSGGLMVWLISLRHVVHIEHCLNATVYLNIVAPLGCGGLGDLWHEFVAQSTNQLPVRLFLGAKGGPTPITWMVYLIKCFFCKSLGYESLMISSLEVSWWDILILHMIIKFNFSGCTSTREINTFLNRACQSIWKPLKFLCLESKWPPLFYIILISLFIYKNVIILYSHN